MGRGRGSATRATREIIQRHDPITAVVRCSAAIAPQQQGLGGELQITNAPPTRRTLPQAPCAYREAGHLEHTFHQVKDRPIGLRPVFVWRDDQICGLTRVLTLALRLLTLIETQVAQGLVAAHASLTGWYEGQPPRATQRPTATRLLKALSRADITLTTVCMSEHREWHLRPVPPWLAQVLAYLKLPPGLYKDLIENSIWSF